MKKFLLKLARQKLIKFIFLLFLLLTSISIFGKVGTMNDSNSPSTAPRNSSLTTTKSAKTTTKSAKVNIKADGTTLVNERPFFPFGFYHVSGEATAEERIQDLQEIGLAGFNTIHAAATNLDDYGEFIDRAEKLGVYVVSEQNIGLLNLINAFKHKPAVLGWNLADDVDNGRLVPEGVLKFHQQAKLADPHHITYITGYTENIEEFGKCADVVAMQSYPIGHAEEENDDISLTYDRISLVRDAVSPDKKAVYANVQAFAWEHTKEPHSIRVPTFDEVRNMTYQALLGGAKGIIYYAYHDQLWHLSSHPALWAGMKTLVPEIKAISSLVLNGQLNKIDVGVEKVIAGMWREGNQSLIVIINRSYKRRGVSIAIPGNFSQIKPIFDNRPATLVLNANRLSGFLTPLGVEVYQATTEF